MGDGELLLLGLRHGPGGTGTGRLGAPEDRALPSARQVDAESVGGEVHGRLPG